jgi:hypothetical protein
MNFKLNNLKGELLFCIIFLIGFSFEYGCQSDPNLCSQNGSCDIKGFCVCAQFYSGIYCEEYALDRPEFVNSALTDGGLAGIILAWMIGVPVVIFLVNNVCLTLRISTKIFTGLIMLGVFFAL